MGRPVVSSLTTTTSTKTTKDLSSGTNEEAMEVVNAEKSKKRVSSTRTKRSNTKRDNKKGATSKSSLTKQQQAMLYTQTAHEIQELMAKCEDLQERKREFCAKRRQELPRELGRGAAAVAAVGNGEGNCITPATKRKDTLYLITRRKEIKS